MKLTTWICCGILILYGIFATVYALFGLNVLIFLCAGNSYAYRAALSLAGIAALWLAFFLFAFRPLRFVS